jgi:hypothetical protein
MVLPHEAVPLCGSFEVRLPDGRPVEMMRQDQRPRARPAEAPFFVAAVRSRGPAIELASVLPGVGAKKARHLRRAAS